MKSAIKKILPYFLAVAVVALSWLFISSYRFARESIRGSYDRVGTVDNSGQPQFFGSRERLKKEYGLEAVKAAWDSAQSSGQLYVAAGQKLIPLKGMDDLDQISIGTNDQKSLVGREKNLLANGSFESGPWQPKVVDCNEYDKKGSLGMSLDAQEKTAGQRSLQLEAKKHTACTFAAIPISEVGEYLLSFDYQSPNAPEAQFFLSFNDRDHTAVSQKIAISGPGWQTYRGQIAVPDGATTATLYLYANSADGKVKMVNRYDDVYFGRLTMLAVIGAPSKPADEKHFGLVKNDSGSWDIEIAAEPASRWRLGLVPVASGLALAAGLAYFAVTIWRATKRRRSALTGRLQKQADKIWKALRFIGSGLSRHLLPAGQDLRRQPWFFAIAVLVGLGLGWRSGTPAGVLCFMFLLFLFYEWDDRVIAALALGSLAACPILLALKQDGRAETLAVYAFYFLTMIVVLRLAEYIRHPDRFHDGQND